MAFKMKDMSGSLFRNEKKEKDTHPNATGSCLIDGVEYWGSAWTNEGAKGKWQSLAFTSKDEKKAAPEKTPTVADLEEDLPF